MTGNFQARKRFVKLKRGAKEGNRVVLMFSVNMVGVQSKNKDN